eukprot:scaffold137775_cov38-Prasinocladus_malaysianus.AAC.1
MDDGRQPAILTNDASESHRVCSSMNASAQKQILVSRENGTMWESHVDYAFQSGKPYNDAYFPTTSADHCDRRVDQQQDQFVEQHRDSSGHKPRIDTYIQPSHSPESAAVAAMASCHNVSISSSSSSG